MNAFKIPRSVLVVIHTSDLQVLLLERLSKPGYWQSVTGSQHEGETLEETARREVAEETGVTVNDLRLQDWRIDNEYRIFPEWRWRYAPGITRNTERVFSLEWPSARDIRISATEHSTYAWMDYREAASLCFSWSNRDALNLLPKMRRILMTG